ncbi:MAG: methylated-DNA--[protein]-cysteine S-methyltransferase [Patescibacteria group bacterium]
MINFKITPIVKGEKFDISYSFFQTSFGICLVASTKEGICNILFSDSKQETLEDLKSRFTSATFVHKEESVHKELENYFKTYSFITPIMFHLIGTPFQTKVWQALISIKKGTTSTYGEIAEIIGNKKSSRAVGTAIGDNPLGYIIPCHRILRSNGELGGFRWGIERKKAMLSFEQDTSVHYS